MHLLSTSEVSVVCKWSNGELNSGTGMLPIDLNPVVFKEETSL